jgi:hypothetical protein
VKRRKKPGYPLQFLTNREADNRFRSAKRSKPFAVCSGISENNRASGYSYSLRGTSGFLNPQPRRKPVFFSVKRKK